MQLPYVTRLMNTAVPKAPKMLGRMSALHHCQAATLILSFLLTNCRNSSQKEASTQLCGRSNGLPLLSAAFDVLRCAVEDSDLSSNECIGAARSVIVMGQCLLAALAQVRSHLHLARCAGSFPCFGMPSLSVPLYQQAFMYRFAPSDPS